MFWVLVFGCLVSLGNICKDHPRQNTPNNLGTDIVIWIVQTLFVVIVARNIWFL
jgi:succinate-acetate transporter protein